MHSFYSDLRLCAKANTVGFVKFARRGSSLALLGARSLDVPVGVEGAEPPTEFRLFRAGANETTKGTFLFDGEAARSVMEKASQHGVDLMVDLEHLSLDTESRNFDPDARAWLALEVRNGELWAVNVRWTDDGMRRLRERTQRYISPAFMTDDENRVTEIVNIALTAMPATYDTPALVAANRSSQPMKREALIKLAARLSIAKGKIAKLADAPADAGGDAGAGKAAAVQAAAEKASAALDDLSKAFDGGDLDVVLAAADAAKTAMDECENAIAALTGAPPDADDAGAAAPPADQAQAQSQQQTSTLSARERAELIELRRREAKRLEDEHVAKLTAEMKERADLKVELVKLGRETPASVETLSELPIGALRKRAELFRSLPPVALGGAKPPVGAGGDVDGAKTFVTSLGSVTLTANQLRECERVGAKPEAFAEHQARLSAKAKG